MKKLLDKFLKGMFGDSKEIEIPNNLLSKPKKDKKPNSKYRRMGYVLLPGYSWNPLTSYPRNKPCFCGGRVKAKKCCIRKVSRICLSENVKALKAILESGRNK